MKTNIDELRKKQSLPLQDKIDLSCERIEQWHNHWDGMVYVAFSGGKDSTVLLDIVRNKALIPDAMNIPAIFCDTGLEYPEIREFVRTVNNVVWLKPKLSFREVIEKYGYPVVSKEQSQYINEYRHTKSDKLRHIRLNGNFSNRGKISAKWHFLIDAPFEISQKCCDVMKKNPSKKYERETDRKAFVGSMVSESSMRTSRYLRFGCNMYNSSRPISNPLAFWLEKDIWEYIKKYDIPYSKIYDMGYSRTGCMFCMFGTHLEKYPNKFQLMQKTHPQYYSYCIEKLGLGKVMDYVGIKYSNLDG